MASFKQPTLSLFVEKHPAITGTRWDKWIMRLKNYFIAADINEAKMKRAALLHYAGEWVLDIFTNLRDTGEDRGAETQGGWGNISPPTILLHPPNNLSMVFIYIPSNNLTLVCI